MVVRATDRRRKELEKSGTPLEKLMRHFEAYNRSEGKSPRTVEWYSRVLRFFQRYLEKQCHSTDLGALTLALVREFVLYLQTRRKWDGHPYILSPEGNLAPVSVNNYVRGLRAFFNWLHREGYTEENVLARLKPPKVPRKLVEVLTDAEVGSILGCLDPNTASGCRDTTIVITLLDTGLRLSEISGLKIADTHVDQYYVKVMGKGAKERMVPIGSTCQKALLRYLFHFRPEPSDADQDYLFLTLEGKPMSLNSVKLIFTRLAQRSGVHRLHAHLCRHTFATNYLINGGDVFSLQQILGHTSLEMVRKYVTLASSQVRVQHRKFSPMDRMNLEKARLVNVTRNGPSNGKVPLRKHNDVKKSSHASPEI